MELLQAGPSETMDLFSGSMELLVDRLHMDEAVLTRVTDEGHEVFWWKSRGDDPVEPLLYSPMGVFCDRVVRWPQRTLVVRDAAQDPAWAADPTLASRGVRSFLGAPLWEGGEVIGTLGVHGAEPRDFRHGEVALVAAVGKLLSRSLEIESLRNQLRQAKEALELSSAVVEDSALHAPSGLPNRHYLDVWMKANLTLAKRNHEGMGLLLLRPQSPAGAMVMAETLRGADLMADLGEGLFLLVLPGTLADGVPVVHTRLAGLGGGLRAAGATLWDPDRDDLALRDALRRLRDALDASTAAAGGALRWAVIPDAI